MAGLADEDLEELIKLRSMAKTWEKDKDAAVAAALEKERLGIESKLAAAREEGRQAAISMLKEMKSLLA